VYILFISESTAENDWAIRDDGRLNRRVIGALNSVAARCDTTDATLFTRNGNLAADGREDRWLCAQQSCSLDGARDSEANVRVTGRIDSDGGSADVG
jgi:hypothetical protein